MKLGRRAEGKGNAIISASVRLLHTWGLASEIEVKKHNARTQKRTKSAGRKSRVSKSAHLLHTRSVAAVAAAAVTALGTIHTYKRLNRARVRAHATRGVWWTML